MSAPVTPPPARPPSGPRPLERAWLERVWTALLVLALLAGFATATALHPRPAPTLGPVTGLLATVTASGTVLDPEPAQLLEVTVVDVGPDPVRVSRVIVSQIVGSTGTAQDQVEEVDLVVQPGEPAVIPTRVALDCRRGGVAVRVRLDVEPASLGTRRGPATVAAVNTGAALRSGCLSALQRLPSGSLSTTVTGRLERIGPDGGQITAGGLPAGRVRSLRAGAWALPLTEPAVIGLDGDAVLRFATPGPPCLLSTQRWSTLPTGVVLTYDLGRQAYVIVGTRLAQSLLDGYQAACTRQP